MNQKIQHIKGIPLSIKLKWRKDILSDMIILYKKK